jgi:hypothetical protein
MAGLSGQSGGKNRLLGIKGRLLRKIFFCAHLNEKKYVFSTKVKKLNFTKIWPLFCLFCENL